MATSDTAPLLQITAGDGKHWKALRNISGTDITCSVTVQHSYYGSQTYNLTVTANQMVQNDCIVNSIVSGTLYGYPAI